MLFMVTFDYGPEYRTAVIERRLDKGAMDPPGIKLHGEWSYGGGGKVFRLVETENAMDFIAAVSAWGDLGEIEIYPVVETEKALEMLGK